MRKISIKLEDAEAQGLMNYMRSMLDNEEDKNDLRLVKAMVAQHVQNLVHGTLNSSREASSDFIERARAKMS